ncbi:MAG TPA: VacB/RNase II family 3'-5' exoribonuclease [Thermoanaerobaculia bacterium]|jgi:ribonuclease R|nr:VacB/RNase II family 3'-5' exoribonuclease [Thermoanaerobaculia bacterium]
MTETEPQSSPTDPRPSSSRAGAERAEARRLLERLAAAAGAGIAAADLANEPRAVLSDLARHARAVRLDERWYAIAHAPAPIGLVDRLERGDAMLRRLAPPVAGGATGGPRGRLWVARQRLRRADSGDVVLYEEIPPRGEPRPGRLAEARVLRVLAHGPTERVGALTTVAEGRGSAPPERRLDPFDPQKPADFAVLGADELPDGTWVRVEIERPERSERADRFGGAAESSEPSGKKTIARVIEVLGAEGDPQAEIRAVIAHFGIPSVAPAEALAEAAQMPEAPRNEDLAGREDWTTRTIVTIDGASTKDFDDAITAEALSGGGFRIAIHVADVGHYVAEGSALDLEAFRRSTSVYYPGRTVPMLPESLSNGLCSLSPHELRLAMAAVLDLDPSGRVVAARFAETAIRSARRLTYTEVRRLLEEPAPGDAAEYGAVLAMLKIARSAMQALLSARLARGSLDFDLPEGDVELDSAGALVGIAAGERHVGHRIVEEFMIAANEAVASELLAAGRPAIYRIHDGPTGERLRELAGSLEALGLPLAVPEGALSDPVADSASAEAQADAATRRAAAALPTAELQSVLRRAAGRPDEAFISALVLRALPGARYGPQNQGHAALAAPRYAHFTSPIRRYPDLVVHRSLKARLRGEVTAAPDDPETLERYAAIAEHATEADKRGERSERELLQWWKVRFLASRIGDQFEGRISGIQQFGVFVVLDGYHVDGLIPVKTLGEPGDERFRYDAVTLRLIGETSGRSLRLADPVLVELVGVDLRHRGLDLRLLATR